MITQEQLEAKQLYLTLKMRDDSKLGENMCETYAFCRFCDKTKDNACARAFYAAQENKNVGDNPQVQELAINVALPPIALKLRTLRMQKNFTVQHVSDVCKIDVEDLLYYEMGKKEPSKEVFETLVSFYS